MTVNFPKIRKHVEKIERELALLKNLLEIEATTRGEGLVEAEEKDIESLRGELRQEGFREDLLQLVGTVPLQRKDYKEEIRAAISAKH